MLSGIVVEVGISILLAAAQTKAQEQEKDDRYSFSLPRTTANTKHKDRKIITLYWMLDERQVTTEGMIE